MVIIIGICFSFLFAFWFSSRVLCWLETVANFCAASCWLPCSAVYRKNPMLPGVQLLKGLLCVRATGNVHASWLIF